jgi:hypothetical protein
MTRRTPPAAYESAGAAYESAGAAYESAGAAYESAGAAYESAGAAYESAGAAYESTARESHLATEMFDPAAFVSIANVARNCTKVACN